MHDERAIRVGVVMGSSSDWSVMRRAVEILDAFGVAHEARVVSAHRMPHEMIDYGATASDRGLRAIIAGAASRIPCHTPLRLTASTRSNVASSC